MKVRVFVDLDIDVKKEGIDSMSDLKGWLAQEVPSLIERINDDSGSIDAFWTVFSKVVLDEGYYQDV